VYKYSVRLPYLSYCRANRESYSSTPHLQKKILQKDKKLLKLYGQYRKINSIDWKAAVANVYPPIALPSFYTKKTSSVNSLDNKFVLELIENDSHFKLFLHPHILYFIFIFFLSLMLSLLRLTIKLSRFSFMLSLIFYYLFICILILPFSFYLTYLFV